MAGFAIYFVSEKVFSIPYVKKSGTDFFIILLKVFSIVAQSFRKHLDIRPAHHGVVIAGDFVNIHGVRRILSPAPGGIQFERLTESRHLCTGAGDGGLFPGLEETDRYRGISFGT